MKYKKILRFAGYAFFLIIFILFVRSFDYETFLTFSNRISYIGWPSISLLFLLSYVFKTQRIKMIYEHINFRKLFFVTVSHNFFLTLLPLRLGEIIFIKNMKKEGIKISKSSSDLFILRVFDIMVILTLCLFFFEEIKMYVDKVGLSILLIIALSLILILFLKRDWITNIIIQVTRKRKKFRFVIEFIQNIKQMGLKKKVYLLGMSYIVWLFSFTPWIIILMQTNNLSISKAFLVVIPAILITSIPINPPAGLGLVEGGWALGLLLIGMPYAESINFAIFAHIILFLQISLIYSLTFLLQRYMKE